MLAQQVLRQAEAHPAPRFGGGRDALADVFLLHQTLVGAARGAHRGDGLPLPAAEGEHLVERALSQHQQAAGAIQRGIAEGCVPRGGVDADVGDLVGEHAISLAQITA